MEGSGPHASKNASGITAEVAQPGGGTKLYLDPSRLSLPDAAPKHSLQKPKASLRESQRPWAFQGRFRGCGYFSLNVKSPTVLTITRSVTLALLAWLL